MTTRQRRAARELVDKLERLAEDADNAREVAEAAWRSDDAVRHAHAGESREVERLTERATNYRHAADLARNTLNP